MKTRLLIIIGIIGIVGLQGIPQAFAEPFVSDDNLIDNLKKNRLPIGQGIYMDFIFFLVVLGGGIGGIIFAIKRKRK